MDTNCFQKKMNEYGIRFETEEEVETFKKNISEIDKMVVSDVFNGKKEYFLSFLGKYEIQDMEKFIQKTEIPKKFQLFLEGMIGFVTISYSEFCGLMNLAEIRTKIRDDIEKALHNTEHQRRDFYFSLLDENERDTIRIESIFEKKEVERKLFKAVLKKFSELRKEASNLKKINVFSKELGQELEKVCVENMRKRVYDKKQKGKGSV